ncbi:MAG: T9SS type A sorting domain-containing protein [Saprospiraceae bacterium]|nr:T9SS type A sorting domain-containing protein [Saprospiraceae bacterium]
MTRTLVLTIAALISFQFTAQSQNITIDSSFGNGGTASFDLGLSLPQAVLTTMQPDGKILALAYLKRNGSFFNNTDYDDISLVRYMPNGVLDNTFGADGVVTLSWGGYDFPTDLQVQPDGKIVLAGNRGVAPAATIARYNADGSIDPSFGTGGKTHFPINLPTIRLNIQPDGKIAVAAFDYYQYDYPFDMVRIRLLADGTLDESFGNAGFIETPYGQVDIVDLKWDTTGRLVTAGYTNQGPTFNRYDPDGNLDLTFGNNGSMFVTSDFGISSFLIHDDGKLVFFSNVNFFEPVVMRVLPDGAPDESFGNNGMVNLANLFFFYDSQFTLPIWDMQADGSIVLVNDFSTAIRILPNGSIDDSFGLFGAIYITYNPNYRSGALVCQPNGLITVLGDDGGKLFINQYFSDGDPNTSFGGQGELITSIHAPFSTEFFSSMAVQSDGKIICSAYFYYYTMGFVYPYPTVYANAIIRLHADGSMDTSFANAGRYDNIDSKLIIQKIAIQPDGKILAIGWDEEAEATRILRLDSQGHIDGTFGQGGILTVFGVQIVSFDQCIAFQAGGKFVISGTSPPYYTPASILVRFDSSGMSDTSFGTNGRIYYPVGANGWYLNLIATQPDGKILTAGQYSNNGNFFVLARYNPEAGTPDPTFGVNGQAVYPVAAVGGANSIFDQLMFQSDGKILVSSRKTNANSKICRFNADGSFDIAFGVNGLQEVPAELGIIQDLKQEESGKLVFLSYWYDEDTHQYTSYCARMNTNGAMDDTYGQNGAATIATLNYHGLIRFLQGGDILAGFTLPPGDVGFSRYKGNISVGVADITHTVPDLLIYPNPVNEASVAHFELQETTSLSVELYDLSGKKVKTIAAPQPYIAGIHQVALSMGQLPRGSYVLVLNSAKWIIAERIVY